MMILLSVKLLDTSITSIHQNNHMTQTHQRSKIFINLKIVLLDNGQTIRIKVVKETFIPETNTDPVKEQNCTISFRAETAIGQSSQ